MLQLSLNSIKALTGGNDRLFRNGFMIHQRNQIQEIRPNTDAGFTVTIRTDEATYKTTLYFYKDTGTFRLSKCSCSEPMPCRHTIAALLNILYKQDTLSTELKSNHTLQMFSAFESLLINHESVNDAPLLHLDMTLCPKDTRKSRSNTTLNLKAGPGALYVVKNIESFIKAAYDKESYVLSKNYSLEKNRYQFSDTDKRIIELLYDYYITRGEITPAGQAHLLTPTKAANLALPETYLKRLLDLLSDMPFNVDYDGFLFKNQQMTDHVEVDFFLTGDDEDYCLSVNTYDVYFPMTSDCRYVFYNNQISHISGKAAEAFELFYRYFEERQLNLNLTHAPDLVNRILPVLEMIGYIDMEESISEAIITEPLNAHVKIDRLDDNIALTLIYRYGEHQLSVYPPSDTESSHMLRRNLEKEHAITSLINTPATAVLDDGRRSYASEEDLFHFIDRVLPELTKLCDVYYSKEFRNTYLRSEKQLVTNLTYNPHLNLLDLDFELEGVTAHELRELLGAVKAKKNYYKLSDGSFFAIDERLKWQVTQLDERFDLNLNASEDALLTAPAFNALYLDRILSEDTRPVSYDAPYRKLLEAVKNPDPEEFPVPGKLKQILRAYQAKGYTWLRALSHYGLGGILADDMGLGKTLQAITLMIDDTTGKPALVVAPTSLLYNWEEEVRKFVPDKSTRVIAGTKQERITLIGNIDEDDIVITSYGALKRDLQLYETPFSYCIIDEAQHIKNPRSLNAQAVKAISAAHRFALSGTPIENTLTELWSIFDFILPGYLGDYKHFLSEYERPIIKENNHQRMEQLSMLIRPFILRRLKEEVLDELPPKIETKVSVELNKHQKKLYMAYVNQAKGELRAYDKMPGGQRSMKILSVLTRLRQICCHPSLFMDNYNHEASKMALLTELIEDSLEGGHRLLIFSQFTSMLGMMRERLESMGIEYFYLDGSVPPIKRQQMVHDFNSGISDIFLISLKAGGTGLNLTGADVVIHYDPWWNPAVENQATDRAYRIGQKKCVQVYKLITAGTIEEKIWQLQKHKEGLIENVIRPGETFINKLSAAELEQLFEM